MFARPGGSRAAATREGRRRHRVLPGDRPRHRPRPRQGGGHVVTMSPPLDVSILPGRVAYGISKLGMTLLTFGLAEEVRRHNVAVNSLWPVTVIESQASINHRLGTPEAWRKPDILVDCVLRLVRKDPADVTGRALVDEDLL